MAGTITPSRSAREASRLLNQRQSGCAHLGPNRIARMAFSSAG
jgi:hypothetical protein